METLGQGIQKMIAQRLEVRGKCPNCEGNMYGWKEKNPDGSERCSPVCMACGYYDMRRKEDRETDRIYQESLKKKTIDFFKFGSVLTDKSLFDCTFDNYKQMDEETTSAAKMAQRFVESVLNGEPKHMVLGGKSGSGKSHLSMAATWAIIEQSDYTKKCLFISYREFLEQIKFSFNDKELRKQIQGSLMKDIKTADLVVVDDLGAELGGTKAGESTAFTNDIINSIFEARQNQATIITTNLVGKEMGKAYGQRITSRIFKNSEECWFLFSKTADKRLERV
ncbi:ATP-binding protein [Enterococcus gallinarum]|uniref:ATP-binding protein n=1 Tax=Enterococcus gallinarum TaxID=1353 RepID=UPI002890B20A|nr:ATP-binding protein [Enterococcus gallinarum]MDT2701317.1 ATP-binding protein [Enterococcus gallinarum]MDT2727930.1 ATP-binding protein [Enterococcus gallinarum]